MTPRERWLALLNGQKPDRIPTDYWATGEVTARLLKDLQCGNTIEMWDKLHIDGKRCFDAAPRTTHHPDDPQADIWGVRFRKADYGTGEYAEADYRPLANVTTVEQVHAFRWPNPDDLDYESFGRQLHAAPRDRAIQVGTYEPFLLYCYMRGMEQAMMDLLVEPDIADAIFGHIFDYYYRILQRQFEIGKGLIDVTYVAEDLGSQHGLLMGIDQIKRFILPNQKRMADLGKSFGIHIFYHTDGAARDVIPYLIDVTGIEVLNPIQWRCPGMEREGLVRDFGKKVIFHGAIDNQQTLPFGSPQDVRNEVLDCIRIFRPARWICAPCHNLQAVSPTENIVAMYETVYENGKL